MNCPIDAVYAKLSMAPLWAEIMEIINKVIGEDGGDSFTVTPKLALYSGHDSTIMPLLASLGPNLWNDTEWAPYAAMVLLEVRFFLFF